MSCEDATCARSGRDGVGDSTTLSGSSSRHTLIAKTSMILCCCSWTTNCHAEALKHLVLSKSHTKRWTHWLESCNLLVAIRIEILLCVIDCHSTIDTVWQCSVLHDGNTLVCAVCVLEEHCCGPVVGKVLGKGTCGTSSLRTDIA